METGMKRGGRAGWRGAVVALAAYLAAGPAGAADLSPEYDWKPMKIGGGGWVVGMYVSPTEKNLLYARTDVSGAYRWNPETAAWKQIVTDESLPAEYVGYGKYAGVDSIVGSAKEPNVAYMMFSSQPYGLAVGQVFRSIDRGDHWTALHFRETGVKVEPNGEGRQEGERLAVDPANGDVIYYASIQDGLWATDDGGAKWKKVAAVPVGKAPHGVNTVVFDGRGGTTGSKTSVIYATVEEGGIFRSADAGATWIEISGDGPKAVAKPRNAKVGPDGTYYVACDNEKGATGAVWEYGPDGKWTDITPPPPEGGSQSYWDVAVDPTDGKRLVAMENGGKCFVSTNQGKTWTYHLFHLNGLYIQWLNKQENYWLSVGELAFDPFVPGKLWFAEGFGVWWAKDFSQAEIPWQAASAGIEEACGNDVIAPPGGKPVGAMWDLGAFYFDDVDAYTAQRSQPNFMSAWSLDWCPADPKFVAAIFRNHLNFPPHARSSGYSTDGGKTWTRFPGVDKETAPASLQYGVIAVSANSPDHLVWCPAEGKLPCYTTDRGATWQQSDCGGLDATGFTSFATSQKPLCADRVQPDTFYLYTTKDGIYRSTDGGAHFAKVGNPDATGRWGAIVKSVPGHAGDLWIALASGGGLTHSTDGGVTWTAVPGVPQANNVGLGKAKDADGYPALYIAGMVNGATGIYRSTDTGATWDRIGGFPLGIFDAIDALDADKDVFGRVYVCFSGAGFAYGAPK